MLVLRRYCINLCSSCFASLGVTCSTVPAVGAPHTGTGDAGAYLFRGTCMRAVNDNVRSQRYICSLLGLRTHNSQSGMHVLSPWRVCNARRERKHRRTISTHGELPPCSRRSLCCITTRQDARDMPPPAAIYEEKRTNHVRAHRHVSGDEHQNSGHGRSPATVGSGSGRGPGRERLPEASSELLVHGQVCQHATERAARRCRRSLGRGIRTNADDRAG